jgi:hypothetical protein
MTSITRRTDQTAVDVLSGLAGLVLFLSPWLFGFATGAIAWNAWIVGIAVVALAVGALVAFKPWEEWINLLLGLWTIVAPWGLGFSANTPALVTYLVTGAVVAAAAAYELWRSHDHWAAA